jgi:TldD protein
VGWEVFLDAQIPEQFSSGQIREELAQKVLLQSKPSTVGKYTLVCDGATIARILENTIGVATQLDRALGYEANAGGTSFLDDPLTMVGQFQVASPLVTVTANRSAPQELATVKWDVEGVVPEPFPIVKEGVLVDFQTTREQAAWLAPCYQSHNLPVHSHGCAAAENAHVTPLQQMPNLALEPSPSAVGLEELVADVKDGILIEDGIVGEVDFQARTGLLSGAMREIKNGKVGNGLQGGVVLYTSQDLWKAIQAIGGTATQAVVGSSAFANFMDNDFGQIYINRANWKGQPSQLTSHSVRAVAATISNQALIDPSRKA